MNAEIELFGEQPPEVQTALAAHQQMLVKYSPERIDLAVKSVEARGIHDEVQMQGAADLLSTIAGGRDAAKSIWEGPKDSAHKTWKALCERFNQAVGVWDALRTRLERPMKAYEREKEQIRQRQQEEANRFAEQMRRQQEAEARKLMRQGEVQAAQALQEQAAAMPAPIVQQEKTKLEGAAVKAPWVVEVTDPMAVLRGIMDGKIPANFVKEYDLAMARKVASALGKLDWPGVKAEPGISFAVKRR